MKLKIKHRVPFDLGDYAMVGASIMTVLFSSLLIIMESNRATEVSTQAQHAQTKLETVTRRNTALHEETTRLSSPERLQAIADKHGLTYNKDNIKNVK